MCPKMLLSKQTNQKPHTNLTEMEYSLTSEQLWCHHQRILLVAVQGVLRAAGWENSAKANGDADVSHVRKAFPFKRALKNML